jgi:hypothetical protein
MASKFDDTDTSSARETAKMVSSYNSLRYTSTKTSAVARPVWADTPRPPPGRCVLGRPVTAFGTDPYRVPP